MGFLRFQLYCVEMAFNLEIISYYYTIIINGSKNVNHAQGGFMKGTHLLTVEEAANRLGLKPCTIRRKILERRIDYVKNGRAVRIPVETVERIISRGYRKAIPERDEEERCKNNL